MRRLPHGAFGVWVCMLELVVSIVVADIRADETK